MNKKILSLSGLKKILRRKTKTKKVVFTNGCFDIIHRGHVEYLKKAKSLGDILVIGLNSDASVKRLKGKGRPINSQLDRAEVLASLEFVDFITIFNEETPYRLIKELRPHILAKGADWKKNEVVGKDIVESYGGKVRLIKYLKGYSTTGLAKLLSRFQNG